MRVKVWGARGSIPSPLSPEAIREKIIAALHGAHHINLADPMAIRDYVDSLDPVASGTAGGNTPCVQIQADGKEIIVDAGSGIRSLGMELINGPCGRGQGEIHLFLSHTHWDHIQGFPFFVPAFIPGNVIHIYAVHDVEPTLRDQMLPATFPVDFAYMRARSTLVFHPLRIGERFQLDNITVTNLRLPHPGEAFAYRFEHNGKSIVYASDAEYKKLDDHATQPYVRFYVGADVLFFDSQFSLRESVLKEDWGHSSSLIGADLARRAGVRRLVLFHHDPTATDQELINIREQTIAYQRNYEATPFTEVYIGREGLAFNLQPVGTFTLQMLDDGQTGILRITEHFDQQAVADVINQIGALSPQAAASAEAASLPRLVVNLGDVPLLTISGLRSLIDLAKLWDDSTLVLAGLSAPSRKVIELANFLDHFTIYPTVEIALASLEAHASLELSGKLFQDRYQIEEKLGQSDLSTVFKATDTRLDRPVTLKVLSPNLGQPATTRLLQQTRHTARLRAPNIVTIYDWDENWGNAYLVMEYAGGQTLRDALLTKTPISPIEIALDVLSALEYAHSKGVIHGNLKPENIILAEEVKLTDFGFWWPDEGIPLTEMPALLGTPDYLAPEQIKGKPVDERADLYALGVMLYEMYTGAHPFEGDPSDTMSRKLFENPVSPRELNPEISISLDHLILKLIAQNPADRYDSASQVKGILLGLESSAEPVAPVEPATAETADRKPRSRPLSSGHRRDEMIERGEAVLRILKLWERAREGNGQVLMLTGEAGVGKSFLVEHVINQMPGGLVLAGRCSESEAGHPYQPFVEIVNAFLAAVPPESVKPHLLDNAAALVSIIPALQAHFPDAAMPAPLEPDQERARLVRSFADLLLRASQDQPVCIVLDNLQWSDAATLQVLTYLARQVGERAMLVLGMYRHLDVIYDHPLRQFSANFEQNENFHLLIVERLTQDGMKDLLEDIWKQTVPVDWVATIYERTGGNPFYVKEVAKSLEDEGFAEFRNGQWVFNTLRELTLPQSVRDLIMRRFSRLDGPSQAMLRQAAVLGRQFTYQELLAVSGQSGTGLLDVMDGLLERNLIRELDGGELLAFSHADIQRTIYDDLDDERQRALHQEVGAALEKLYEESLGQNASRLAHHFIRAGDKANGLTYGLMAAQQACSIYAFQNALYWFNQVVRLLPEGENHLAERIILHEGLGTIFQVQANYTDARLAFDTMEKTAGKAGDKAAQGRALIGLAGVQDDLGDHRGALGTIRRAIQLAQEARDDENMLKGLAVQGWVYLNLGDYSSARMVGERALIISRKLGVDHEVARHLNLLGMVHVSLGDYQRSENYLQEAYVMYRGLRDRDYQGRVLNNLGENARRRGDYEKANRYFNEALAVAREIGNLDAEITFMNNLGGAQVGAGEYAEGERNLREVLQMVEVSGWSHTTETYIYLAEACLWQDKFDDALAAGEKAIALGQEREQLEYVGRAWRALGVIARETRNPVTIPERTGGVTNGRTGELARRGYSGKFRKYEPNECFMKSMRIFDELGLQAERARTLREWAKLDQRVGDAETARRRWEEAISLFQQLGMEAEAARMSIAAGY